MIIQHQKQSNIEYSHDIQCIETSWSAQVSSKGLINLATLDMRPTLIKISRHFYNIHCFFFFFGSEFLYNILLFYLTLV